MINEKDLAESIEWSPKYAALKALVDRRADAYVCEMAQALAVLLPVLRAAELGDARELRQAIAKAREVIKP